MNEIVAIAVLVALVVMLALLLALWRRPLPTPVDLAHVSAGLNLLDQLVQRMDRGIKDDFSRLSPDRSLSSSCPTCIWS